MNNVFICLLLPAVLGVLGDPCSNKVTSCLPLLSSLNQVTESDSFPGTSILSLSQFNSSYISQLCSIFNDFMDCKAETLAECPELRDTALSQQNMEITFICSEAQQDFLNQKDCLSGNTSLFNSWKLCGRTNTGVNTSNVMDNTYQSCQFMTNYTECVTQATRSGCGDHAAELVKRYINHVTSHHNCTPEWQGGTTLQTTCVKRMDCTRALYETLDDGDDVIGDMTVSLDILDDGVYSLLKDAASLDNNTLGFLCRSYQSLTSCAAVVLTSCGSSGPSQYRTHTLQYMCSEETVLLSERHCLLDDGIYTTWQHCLMTYITNLNSSAASSNTIRGKDWCRYTEMYEECFAIVIDYQCSTTLARFAKLYNRHILDKWIDRFQCNLDSVSYISVSVIPAVVVCCLLVVAFVIVWRRPRSCPWVKYSHNTFSIRRPTTSSTPHLENGPHSPYMQLNSSGQPESSFSFDTVSPPSGYEQHYQSRNTINVFQNERLIDSQRSAQEVSMVAVNWRIGSTSSHESSTHDI